MEVADAQWEALLTVFWEAHDRPGGTGIERVYDGIRAILAALPAVERPAEPAPAALIADNKRLMQERDAALIWQRDNRPLFKVISTVLDEVGAPRVDEGGDNMLADGRVEWACDALREARAQLAARPEPVVVDEALADRVARAYDEYRENRVRPMLEALRSAFAGCAVSESTRVQAILCELEGVNIHRAQLRAELQAAQTRLDDYERRLEPQYCTDEDRTGEDLPIGMALRRLSDGLVMAQRELQAAQAELEREFERGVEMQRDLKHAEKRSERWREQHEALLAGVEYGCEALERHDGPENKTTSWYAERFRALLKPATPEPQAAQVTREAFLADPAAVLERSERGPVRVMNGDEPRMTLSSPRTDNATVTPGHQYASRADVERLEAALRCFLRTSSAPKAMEALALLDARKQEGGDNG